MEYIVNHKKGDHNNIKVKFNKFFYIALLFSFLQEILSALSTIAFIVIGINGFATNIFLIWFPIAIGSLVVWYIPSILNEFFFQKAIHRFSRSWIFDYSNLFYMNPQLLNNTDFQNKKSIYINQILDNANNMYVNTQIIITMIFSSIINAVIFCIGISPIYLIALIFVIIGTAYQIKFSIKKRRSIAINLQSIDAKVHTSLLSGWITTIVGNRVNFSKWKNNWTNSITESEKVNSKSSVYLGEIDLISVLCTLLPLLLVNFLTMYQYNFDAEIIEVVCLTFMQQYAFMSMVSSFISTGVNSYILSTKINDIAKKLCVDKNSNSYESFIKWDKLFLFKNENKTSKGIKIESLKNLKNLTNDFSPGVYTVRGDNGTGKSLMFANIKKKYGEQVFLFPVTSELYFRDSPNDGYSTGQKVMENLDFISNNNNLKNIRILLLDEWDANLDIKNSKIINKKLDALKKNICIIQIRHKFDKTAKRRNL